MIPSPVEEGVIYFVASTERVRVAFDDELVDMTTAAIQALRGLAQSGHIPAPLEDSPKCPRCSLVGICMPERHTATTLRFSEARVPRPH